MENKYKKSSQILDDEYLNNEHREYIVKSDYKKIFSFPILKVEGKISKYKDEDIVGEFPLALVVNGEYLNTFLCTPESLQDLVVGFLSTKGMIKSKKDILDIDINIMERIAYAKISQVKDECKNDDIYLNKLDYINAKPVEGKTVNIKLSDAYKVMKKNLTCSKLFKETGGVHSVCIFDNKDVIVSREDVARHNAVDKAIGYCIRNEIDLKDKIIFISGRISLEMILKAAKMNIPIVISKSAPTNLSVEISKKLNITLIGFVRGERMNIYANADRVIFD